MNQVPDGTKSKLKIYVPYDRGEYLRSTLLGSLPRLCFLRLVKSCLSLLQLRFLEMTKVGYIPSAVHMRGKANY